MKPDRGFVYKDVFVSAGAEYRRVFHHWIVQLQTAGMIAPDAAINEVSGGIG